MGEFDKRCKIYFENPERFAALCNYYFYRNSPVIQPYDIVESDTAETAPHGAARTRDLVRYVSVPAVRGESPPAEHAATVRGGSPPQTPGTPQKLGVQLIVVGLETERYTDYSEPVKIMCYDAGRYSRQVREIRRRRKRDKGRRQKDFLSPVAAADRLMPAVTLVLCLTDKKWDGPKSLYDMLDMPPGMENYVNDYRLNIINPKEMSDEEIAGFPKDLKLLLGFVKHGGSREDMLDHVDKNREMYKIVDEETYDMINLYSNNKLPERENGGEFGVCRGIDELIEYSEAQGKAIGIAEGEARGKAAGIAEGEARGKAAGIDALMKKTGIDLTEACDLLDMTVEEYNECRRLCGAIM